VFRRRIIFLSCVFGFIGLILIGRLAQIQLLWSDDLEPRDYSSSEGYRLLETTRGTIYTADGVPLARDEVAYDISVHYTRLKEEEWRRRLSRLADIPLSRLNRRARRIRERVRGVLEWVRERSEKHVEKVAEQERHHPVVEDVSLEVATYVRTHSSQFPGVKVTPRAVRRYPHGTLAPHVVGHLSSMSGEKWDRLKKQNRVWEPSMPERAVGGRYLQDDRIGVTGMEKTFESLLRGERGYVERRHIFRTLEIDVQTSITPPEPGSDVYLTLRRDLQSAANDALAWAAKQEELEFDRGALVVVDIRDGAVLAASTFPGFDLSNYRNNFSDLSQGKHSPLLYRPTQAAVPPGSVFKLVTAIAGLETGSITGTTSWECKGYRDYRGRRFNCTSQWGHGRVELLEAIRDSCNVYFFEVGRRVGGEKLAAWGRRFGLGESTGIRLPNRRTGHVPEPGSLFGDLNLAIGQGNILVTPLQVARMAAGIATGGRLPELHFFRDARTLDGGVVSTCAEDARSIRIEQEVLRIVREGMREVVRSGTAEESGLDRFSAAGKTGTASITVDLNHAWFAGYAPADRPRVAFAVLNERTPGHGGSHAAPIAAHFFEATWDKLPPGESDDQKVAGTNTGAPAE